MTCNTEHYELISNYWAFNYAFCFEPHILFHSVLNYPLSIFSKSFVTDTKMN